VEAAEPVSGFWSLRSQESDGLQRSPEIRSDLTGTPPFGEATAATSSGAVLPQPVQPLGGRGWQVLAQPLQGAAEGVPRAPLPATEAIAASDSVRPGARLVHRRAK
jgi:hypothetical protein